MATRFAELHTEAQVWFYDDDITITNADIIQGGLTVNNYSSNGEQIEIGNAIAGELSLTLENGDGRWDSVDFVGKMCRVIAVCSDSDYTTNILEGYEYEDNYVAVNCNEVTVKYAGERTITLASIPCKIPETGMLYTHIDPDTRYNMTGNSSDVATVTVEEVDTNGDVTRTFTLGTTTISPETSLDYYYHVKVTIPPTTAAGTYSFPFSIIRRQTSVVVGYYNIDEAVYSRDRLSLQGLDRISEWDVQPEALGDYSEPGFQVYSSLHEIYDKPSGTLIGYTKAGDATIAEVNRENNELWFRLAEGTDIWTTGSIATTAGNNAWISAETTTETLMPSANRSYYSTWGVTTPITNLRRLLGLEMWYTGSPHENVLQLDSDAKAELESIKVNHFKLGNQFTLHQLIAYAAGLLGKNVVIRQTEHSNISTGKGLAQFIWYDMVGADKLTPFYDIRKADAYNIAYQPRELEITGATLTVNGTTYDEGDSDYTLNFGDNALVNAVTSVTYNEEEMSLTDYFTAKANSEEYIGLTYSPIEATIVENPYNGMGWVSAYNTETGITLMSPVTDWTWTLNGATKLRSRGSYLKALPSSSGGSSGGGSSGGGSSGGGSVASYTTLLDKPKINGVTLTGDKSFEDLGLNALTNAEIDAVIQ